MIGRMGNYPFASDLVVQLIASNTTLKGLDIGVGVPLHKMPEPAVAILDAAIHAVARAYADRRMAEAKAAQDAAVYVIRKVVDPRASMDDSDYYRASARARWVEQRGLATVYPTFDEAAAVIDQMESLEGVRIEGLKG